MDRLVQSSEYTSCCTHGERKKHACAKVNQTHASAPRASHFALIICAIVTCCAGQNTKQAKPSKHSPRARSHVGPKTTYLVPPLWRHVTWLPSIGRATYINHDVIIRVAHRQHSYAIHGTPAPHYNATTWRPISTKTGILLTP